MVCDYFTNIGDSNFYSLYRENGYQIDMTLSEIVDTLFVDENYIAFSQETYTDANDEKLDNFFTHVVSFVGFFMIHNLHPDSIDVFKAEFMELYKPNLQ
jgi:hypothetical protein